MLSCVSFNADSFALTASSVYAMSTALRAHRIYSASIVVVSKAIGEERRICRSRRVLALRKYGHHGRDSLLKEQLLTFPIS